MTTREFYLISECYTNPNFSAEVYLEMMDQYPNSIMTYNEFCNMVNNIFDNYYNEACNGGSTDNTSNNSQLLKQFVKSKYASIKNNRADKNNFKLVNKMSNKSLKKNNEFMNKMLKQANS